MAYHELEEWAKDCIVVNTEIHLDWRDRWRAFFGRPIRFSSYTQTEFLPGKVRTTQVEISVDAILPRRRQMEMGVVTSPEAPEQETENG